MSNGVILQTFHWYSPGGGRLWPELRENAAALGDAGFTAVWLPPAGKGTGPDDVGYGAYDLFDLGEFDQKGTVRTKYGTREELLAAIRALQGSGLQVYADVVHNHKDRADETETVWGQPVDWRSRNHPAGEWEQFEAWTRFTFPGRGDRYSSFKWSWWCFDSLSYNASTRKTEKLYRLKDRGFETEVSHEHGNYDYLLANDLDLGVDLVCGELLYWGRWFVETTGVDGFRLDACKHIRAGWFPHWLGHLRSHSGRELFAGGGVLVAAGGGTARLPCPDRQRPLAVRCAAALQLPLRQPGRQRLRPAHHPGPHPGEGTAGEGSHLRGQPRHPAL